MAAILLLPLILGMSVASYLPRIAQKIAQPVRIASMFMLIGFIIAAVLNNQDAFAVHRAMCSGSYYSTTVWH